MVPRGVHPQNQPDHPYRPPLYHPGHVLPQRRLYCKDTSRRGEDRHTAIDIYFVIMFLFSFYMIYEYSVIVRPYSFPLVWS